jgi:hypothetical protein
MYEGKSENDRQKREGYREKEDRRCLFVDEAECASRSAAPSSSRPRRRFGLLLVDWAKACFASLDTAAAPRFLVSSCSTSSVDGLNIVGLMYCHGSSATSTLMGTRVRWQYEAFEAGGRTKVEEKEGREVCEAAKEVEAKVKSSKSDLEAA